MSRVDCSQNLFISGSDMFFSIPLYVPSKRSVRCMWYECVRGNLRP